jgi:hypothetical protein
MHATEASLFNARARREEEARSVDVSSAKLFRRPPYAIAHLLTTRRRVGQLEEKIDGIMSLLNASRELHLQTTPPSSNPSPFQGPATASFGQEPDTSSSTTPVSRMPANAFSVCLPSRDSFDIAPGLVVSVDEADQMLDWYRSDYSPKFPFVPIAPCLTACELYETKPFLFRVIIQAIAPQSFTTQREVARWIRKYLAEHVLVAQETRLELLQGLLLYIAW